MFLSYQGDGDLAAIGTAETVHAAARGRKYNGNIYKQYNVWNDGGQMAPTTLPGQVTQTTPYGRDVQSAGFPVKMCEILAQIDGTALAQRVSVDSPKEVMNAKKAIRKAFINQRDGKGFSIVEVLSTCPTNWGFRRWNLLKD